MAGFCDPLAAVAFLVRGALTPRLKTEILINKRVIPAVNPPSSQMLPPFLKSVVNRTSMILANPTNPIKKAIVEKASQVRALAMNLKRK